MSPVIPGTTGGLDHVVIWCFSLYSRSESSDAK
jgi:hypothetical protein